MMMLNKTFFFFFVVVVVFFFSIQMPASLKLRESHKMSFRNVHRLFQDLFVRFHQLEGTWSRIEIKPLEEVAGIEVFLSIFYFSSPSSIESTFFSCLLRSADAFKSVSSWNYARNPSKMKPAVCLGLDIDTNPERLMFSLSETPWIHTHNKKLSSKAPIREIKPEETF